MTDRVGAAPDGTARTVLLGPVGDHRAVAEALDRLGVAGQVAIITAGWQENEGEDDALRRAIGRRSVNLELHMRSEEIYDRDEAFRDAWVARQKHLQHLQDFYRVRLEAIDEADHAIAVRHVEPSILAGELSTSVSQLQHIDRHHLDRMAGIHAAFEARWHPGERPAIRQHREEVARVVDASEAVVVSGGHVMSLLNRVRLMDAFAAIGARPVVAWSAGAMILTDRVVLFHDKPPYGKNLAQVVDRGLGRCPGVVVLPHASERIQTEVRRGLQRFVHRMAPAACQTLDPGEHLAFEGTRLVEARSHRFHADGSVVTGEVE